MTDFAKIILEEYRNGKRYFYDLNLEYENFDDQDLQDIIFEICFLYSSFRRANLTNAKFINGNIKTCDFTEANLTNAYFENLSVEGAQFAREILFKRKIKKSKAFVINFASYLRNIYP